MRNLQFIQIFRILNFKEAVLIGSGEDGVWRDVKAKGSSGEEMEENGTGGGV